MCLSNSKCSLLTMEVSQNSLHYKSRDNTVYTRATLAYPPSTALSLHLSFLTCLMSCSRPCSPSASLRVRRSSSPSSAFRARRSSRSPRASPRGVSRASSLHSEICRGGQFHCVPGSQVFHLDGSVRSPFASKIGSAHIMLPDGTSQRYEEYCQKCASPLMGDKVKVNVMLHGNTTYPFLFKSLLVYHHLFYKTCINDQWVTISGAHLQPSGDPNFLIFSNKSALPIRVYELYPTTAVDQGLEFPSTVYPFYYRGITISRDQRYKIQVGGRYVVVFGSQLHPGSDCVLLCQGPGKFVSITEIYPYEVTFRQPSDSHLPTSSTYFPAQRTTSYNPTYSFVFNGLPIYPHAHYKILISSSWVIVQGSQLSLAPDGSGVFFYKDPSTPVSVSQVVAISSDSEHIRPVSPQRQSPRGYSPTYPYPSYHGYVPGSHCYNPGSPGYIPGSPGYIPGSHSYNPGYLPNSPSYVPTPGYRPPSPQVRRPSPQPAAINCFNQQTSTTEINQQSTQNINQQTTQNINQQTTQNINQQTTQTVVQHKQPAVQPQQQTSTQDVVKPYDPVKNTVPPTDRDYPYLFKGLNIHSDRMYKVKINTAWEIVHGYQLHPAKNDPNSLIVNFANFNSAIITDIFLYQPERYTPVSLTVRGVVIYPDQKYYVDLGSGGSLIVPGSMIQRHTTRGVGMVWYNENYHEILDVRVIVNSESVESSGVEVLKKGVEVSSCTCQTQPCTITPLQCPNCTPQVDPIPEPPPVIVPPLPTSTPGILRSPSRTTTVVEKNSTTRQSVEKKSVSVNEKNTIQIVSSSPDEEETTSSSTSPPGEDPIFKNIKIFPDSLYSVLLENNTTIIVSGKFIQAKRDRKYVKVRIDNEMYKSYFIRPVTPEQPDDEVTPKNTGFYRIYLNGKWRLIPENNVRPSKRRPGRYVVIYTNRKFIVKAVNVVPVSLPDGGEYPQPDETTLSPSRPSCSSPVHPHPITPEQHAARRSPSPDRTLHPSLKELNSESSTDTTPGAEDLPPNVVHLSSLYDSLGQLKPQYASLLALRDSGHGGRRGTTPLVLLPTDRVSNSVPYNPPTQPSSSHLKPANFPPTAPYQDKHPGSPARNETTNSPYVNPTFNNISRVVEERDTSSPIPMVINGTLVFPDKQYILSIESVSYVVTGKQFKPRKQVPGQFTLKTGDCRLLVPTETAIIPYVTPPSPSKSVKFAECSAQNCTAENVPDSDEDVEPGFLALIKGCWVRVGPKAVRPSKTQSGYAVVKYKDSVSLILETDVHPLKPLEDVINLECKLPDGRRLLRTWFVERLPANCLEYVRSVSTDVGENPVFVLRNSGTRNINDKDIRKVTACIRTHFEGAQVIFEDDYLQLAEDGFGVKYPIWVNVRRNKRPHYYKLLEDLTDKSYMDVSLSENSYLQTMTTYNTPVTMATYNPPVTMATSHVPNASTSRNISSKTVNNVRSSSVAQRSTFSSSQKFTSASSKTSSNSSSAARKSALFNRINRTSFR